MLVPLVPARDPRVLHLLGNLYLESGDRAAALEPLRIAAHLRPDDTEVQLDLVRCLVHLERKDAAAALCEQLCRRIPENPLLWNLRGLCTPALQEAAAWFRRALALQPGYADAAVYLARRLVDDTRAAEALPVLDAALALNPQHPELHYTRGVALIELDRAREALAANSAAIALQPDHANAQWNRALCHLRLGEFSAGWAGYDWRWHHDTKELRRYAAIPEWPADRPRSGRLLVWSEQGVGDEVMFATLLPHLAGKVDEVVVACCPRLVPLFARSFPSFTIVPQDPDRRVPDPEIQADWQIPAGALPARLWTPAGHPGGGRTVLAADPRLTSQLRARYHATGRPAVGIAWRTNNSRNGAARTISPTQWAPHLRSLPARLVSLQYGDTKSDLDAAAAAGVEIFQDAEVDQLRNLDAFAAQIAAVDAIITIDNSTVHFAGALGCPTILLLPTPADWRWLSEGATTTWYKSVGIQRRAFEEGWDAPLNRALADILATITPGGTSTSPDSK
jgi:Flp pilus assembly protein TadD